MCCGSQAQRMGMYAVRICMQHPVSSALVMHNTTKHNKGINNNLLRNQSVDRVIFKLHIIICFKGT